MKTHSLFLPKSLARLFAAAFFCLAIFTTGCEPPFDEGKDSQAAAADPLAPANMHHEHGELPHKELARLRAAVARYHNFNNALADGYDFDLTGYRSRMGHHYLKMVLLDGTFELERPELLIYVQEPNKRWRFVGVEYAVPIADMNNIPPPPAGFSGDADEWAVNGEFEVWTLHVWIGLNNPDGIFAPRNPRLP